MIERDDDGVVALVEVPDEPAIDLQLLHRETRQVGERRVAGAEVVDGDPDAHVVGARWSTACARCGVRHQHALRQLELERLGPAARGGARRESDTRRAAPKSRTSWTETFTETGMSRPDSRHLQRPAAHAIAQGLGGSSATDHPGVLDDRDELVRRDQPALGMLPPDEGLYTRRLAGRDSTLRLVHEGDLLGSMRVAARPRPQASGAVCRRSRVHGAGFRAWPRTSRRRRGARAVDAVPCSGTSARPMLASTRRLSRPTDRLGERLDDRGARPLLVGGIGRGAGRRTRRRRAGRRPGPCGRAAARRPAEQLVAAAVAEGVVDLLEAVEVQHQERDALVALLGGGKAPRERCRSAACGSGAR